MPNTTRLKMLNMSDITLHPEVFAPLRPLVEVVSLPPDREVLLSSIGDFDIYYASLFVQVTEEILARAGRLRIIVTQSTGTDHIDLAAAAAAGIQVISLKEDTEFLGSITATAEMAWALLLAVVRRLPWSFDDVKQGRWGRDAFRGHQLAGKTLGIIGYGRLGRIVAQYARSFRMRVLACDTRPVEPEPGVTMTDHATLLREAEVISLHIHMTEENRGLLDAAAFAAMMRGVVIINTSRGAVIDETSFLLALESGQVGGAGLDVIDGEWRNDLATHPLITYARSHDNLVISPHLGGATVESQRMTAAFAVGKLKKTLEACHEQT